MRHFGVPAFRRFRGKARRWRFGFGMVALTVLGWTSQRSSGELPNGVAAGDVDQTSAVLWARSRALGAITFDYSTDSQLLTTLRAEAAVGDPMVPVKVEIVDLDPGTTYYYRVTDASGTIADGSFRTPPAIGFNGLRFGVSGDWRGDLRPFPAVHNVVESDLDFFIALGDTIYADIATPDVPTDQSRTLDEMRRKHNEVYAERFGINTFAEIRSSTVWYTCIDDHEMTNDFCGGAPPATDPRFDQTGDFINETDLYRNGMQAFLEFNPVREEVYGDTGDARTANKPKLYRLRRFGSDAAFFMVDARSFRDDSPPLLNHPPNYWENQAYLANAYSPARTMLGAAQLELLRSDLSAAQAEGITWKFVIVPEPVQNLGPIIGSDRFEGYAVERASLFEFINENGISNVVFIAADIHGTIVNELVYRQSPTGPPIRTAAFEITTGSVAFAEPLGAATLKFAPPNVQAWFEGKTQIQRDILAQRILDGLLTIYGYPLVGLQGSPIAARLLEGRYLAVNGFGWTQFEIDADTQRLTVTTYGIPWYSPQEIAADPDEVIARQPQVVSLFTVDPREPGAPLPGPRFCGALGTMPFLAVMGLMRMVGRRRWFTSSNPGG